MNRHLGFFKAALLAPGSTFFDYGCGLGGDMQSLAALGYEVGGWDSAHLPDGEQRPADVVNLGYVINVIENPPERAEALRHAWELTRGVLILAARLDFEAHSVSGRRYGDGIPTSKGTFQKFYSHEELRTWIDSILGIRSTAAAPGVFYAFRDDVKAQSLLAARTRLRPEQVRRLRLSETLYETFSIHSSALSSHVDGLRSASSYRKSRQSRSGLGAPRTRWRLSVVSRAMKRGWRQGPRQPKT